jgi:uncharacterized damage-inducible protein DinB
MTRTAEDLRYPIGTFKSQPFSERQKKKWLDDIRSLPEILEQAILNLDEEQLQTPYREGGWTVHQLVHHVADSHLNAYCRFKLGLTEDNPVIRPYEEKAWAVLDDVRILPVNISLTLLHALHIRWLEAMRGLAPEQWQRTVFHPEQQISITLWDLMGSYAWHGKHHVAHISNLRTRNHW